MKNPCYALLVNYVNSYMYWEFIQDDEEFKEIVTPLMGNSDSDTWERYYKSHYQNVFVVDADEVIIFRNTLAECVEFALKSTKDQVLARYVDAVASDNQELQNMSFNQFVHPYLYELMEITKYEEFSKPSLKSYIDNNFR